MTERERELYERHQTLVALVGVLLHELRNPLHAATLLVEAMGMKPTDAPQFRVKLKNQFAKLEAILTEVGQPVKELALEPEPVTFALGDAVEAALELAEPHRSCDVEISLEGEQATRVVGDRVLLQRAIYELLLRVLDPRPNEKPASRLVVRVAEPVDGEARLVFEDDGGVLDELTQRTPFSLAHGGLRLATARAVSNLAGGSLRYERTESGSGSRFVLLVPLA